MEPKALGPLIPLQLPLASAAEAATKATSIEISPVFKAKMDEAMENGRGIAVLNGKMLDRPVAQQAEKVLAMARAAGIRIEEVSYE